PVSNISRKLHCLFNFPSFSRLWNSKESHWFVNHLRDSNSLLVPISSHNSKTILQRVQDPEIVRNHMAPYSRLIFHQGLNRLSPPRHHAMTFFILKYRSPPKEHTY